jgi:hypothetical protein
MGLRIVEVLAGLEEHHVGSVSEKPFGSFQHGVLELPRVPKMGESVDGIEDFDTWRE